MRIPFLVAFMAAFAVSGDCAEILFDDGQWRVVTGDWAARSTRGIEFETAPTNVNSEQVLQVLTAEIPAPLPIPAETVASAIRKFGWAQIEFEPERSPGRTIHRIFVRDEPPLWLSHAVYDIERGHLATAGLSLTDGTLQIGIRWRPR